VTDRAASPGQHAGDRDGRADDGGDPGGGDPGGGAPHGWRLAVDTGGTFTDCLAVDPRGRVRRAKVLSTAALRTRIVARLGEAAVRLMPIGGAGGGALPADFFAGCSLRLLGSGEDGAAGWRVLASGPEAAAAGAAAVGAAAVGDDGPERRLGATLRLDGTLPAGELAGAAVELQAAEEAPVLAARLVTATPPGQPLPPLAMRLATTRGTNALLERKGAPVALFLTRGFADLLRIGTQQRPELFALAVERPAPLYRAVVEVDERLAADGSEIAPLDLAALRGPAGELLAAGVSCAAVALLHSYRDPRHERELGAFLRELGFRHVSLSAELAPLIKLLPRAETAVVDAYLAPVLADYLAAVAAELPSGALHVMTSAGGLVRASSFRAKDSLLSGPAGGVVGAARAGRASGFERVIAFDMGGTSTDVARFDGDFEYLFEHRVGDAHLVAPALAIESVAAGGGSICAYHGGRLQVGPESAGARPGPACYGAGGPLTLTDVNLLLGRLAAGRFEIPLDPGAAERAATALLDSLEPAPAGEPGPHAETVVPLMPSPGPVGAPVAARREEVLGGLLAIADERMAEAIRGISLRRGYDPAEYALVAFGGAGAQHACAVAALLGMDTVLVPADAGLLSALGLGAAVVERFAQRQVLLPLAAAAAHLDGWCEELGREAAAAVAAEGVPRAEVEVRRRIVALRFAGQESTLPVEYLGAAALAGAFAAAYREVYGYEPEGRAIEVESMRVVASSGRVAASAAQAGDAGPVAAAHRVTMQQAFIGGAWREVPAYERSSLVAGAAFAGPALVVEDHTATVVEADWTCCLDEAAALVLRRRS
jgi:5-oxoprolinase (ATP-hydrolysing)